MRKGRGQIACQETLNLAHRVFVRSNEEPRAKGHQYALEIRMQDGTDIALLQRCCDKVPGGTERPFCDEILLEKWCGVAEQKMGKDVARRVAECVLSLDSMVDIDQLMELLGKEYNGEAPSS